MAQMVPGDQINVVLRKQLLLGMFPARPAAACAGCCFSGLQLGFPSSCVETGSRLVHAEGSALARGSPAYAASLRQPQPPFPMVNPLMKPWCPPAPPSLVQHCPWYIVCLYLVQGLIQGQCPVSLPSPSIQWWGFSLSQLCVVGGNDQK